MPITPICHFWKAGSCRNGEECKFLHPPLEFDTILLVTPKSTTTTPAQKRSLSPALTPPPEKRRAIPSYEPSSPVSSLNPPVPQSPLPQTNPPIPPKLSPRSPSQPEVSEPQKLGEIGGPLTTIFAIINTTRSVTPSREIRTIVGISSTIDLANEVVKSAQARKFGGEHERGIEGDGRMWIREGDGLVGNEVMIEKWEVDKGIPDPPAAEEVKGEDDWDEEIDWEVEGDGESIDFGLG